MAGIPLADAGRVGETVGGTRWFRVGGDWFYYGTEAWLCEDRNTTLVVTPERGMSAEEFGRLWRSVVRDLMRVAKCVRVRVCERTEGAGHSRR